VALLCFLAPLVPSLFLFFPSELASTVTAADQAVFMECFLAVARIPHHTAASLLVVVVVVVGCCWRSLHKDKVISGKNRPEASESIDSKIDFLLPLFSSQQQPTQQAKPASQLLYSQ